MHVCIVSSWFPTADNPSLGSFVYNYARNLGKHGLLVSVISILGYGDKMIRSHNSLTIYRVSQRRLATHSILKLILRIKPDIIHVHAPNVFSSNAVLVAKLLRLPIIATVHRAEVESTGSPFLSFLRTSTLHQFQRIVAVSDFSRSLALNAGAEENKFSVIHNFCDETRFFFRDQSSVRVKLGLPLEKKIILFVGNLIARKGIHTLVNALRIVRDSFPDFLAIIIGKGEEEEKLTRYIKSFNLENCVMLYGWCSDDQLPYFYNAADVFILPSTMEGHSVAILEAMASGIPIVASDIEGNRESIEEGTNGFLFEKGNDKALAQKLLSLLGDSNLRQRISHNNMSAYSQKFSEATQIEKYLEVYRSLVKSKKGKDNDKYDHEDNHDVKKNKFQGR
jgi:glycosyltransferase involved in cell wall biosynthesis